MDGKIIIKSPKSRRSWRTLPLFEPVTSALETLYKAQAAEKEAAGPAYAGDVDAAAWSPMNSASRSTPSGTPMSSAASAGRQDYSGFASTTREEP